MLMPDIVHPKVFKNNGVCFRVVTYEPVSDDEARKIVLLFLRTQRVRIRKGQTCYVCYNNANGTFLP